MQRLVAPTCTIVIPTGRTSCCCILPCALMLVLEAGAGAAALLLVRHLIRCRAAGRGSGTGVSRTLPVRQPGIA